MHLKSLLNLFKLVLFFLFLLLLLFAKHELSDFFFFKNDTKTIAGLHDMIQFLVAITGLDSEGIRNLDLTSFEDGCLVSDRACVDNHCSRHVQVSID